MKRLSFALAASLMMMPLTTLAAYSTPAELMAAVQNNSIPRTFSVTAHTMNDGTYVSVWANGTEQGMDPHSMQMTTKATVDVARGNLKIRAKTEVLVTGGMLYVRLTSFEGSYHNLFASLSGKLMQQQWISMPLDEAMLSDLTGGTPLEIGATDPSMAENMFHMQSAPGKNGTTVYTLSLTQDYAVTLAQLIREILQDNSSASDDFFPWRQLADGMRFESTVITDAKDMFLSSTFSLSTASAVSSLSISGTQQRIASAVNVTAPANSVSVDQALASFSDLTSDLSGSEDYMMVPQEESMMDSGSTMTEPAMSEGTFNSVDEESSSSESADCSDPSISPMQLMMLQRTGACSIERKSTRYGGW